MKMKSNLKIKNKKSAYTRKDPQFNVNQSKILNLKKKKKVGKLSKD